MAIGSLRVLQIAKHASHVFYRADGQQRAGGFD
jgi:hypothetical protein